MNIISDIKKRAKTNIKTILLPELDIRILKACKIVKKEGFANVILVGNTKEIINFAENNKINIKNINIIDPNNYNNIETVINEYYLLRRDKGVTREEARETILNNYMYFSCMLVKLGCADGVVSGAIHTSSDTIRPALQIIKAKSGFASSFFLMDIKDIGPVIYSDCGMIQNPTDIELADISYQASNSYKLLMNNEAKIALLSHSTFGSSICDDQRKVVSAVQLAHQKYPELNLDGELQFDAAICPDIAKIKAPNSKVAGYANTFIFPDLDSGNIAYKITERLGNCHAYGPIMQGLNKPVNDLSRGSSIEDIVGVIAITALQAQK